MPSCGAKWLEIPAHGSQTVIVPSVDLSSQWFVEMINSCMFTQETHVHAGMVSHQGASLPVGPDELVFVRFHVTYCDMWSTLL